jgi:glyceraldehyde 3-phosphate dehydrogenase
MTTINSYTNDQVVQDEPHKDLRRARAACSFHDTDHHRRSPAIAEVIPEMKGKLDGLAIRVPTPMFSLVDFVATLSKKTSKNEINDKFGNTPTVDERHFDVFGRTSLFLAISRQQTLFHRGYTQYISYRRKHGIEVLSWYDNEWGFSNRMLELLIYIMK